VSRWLMSIAAPTSVVADLLGPNRPVVGLSANIHGFWIGIIRLFAHGWVYSFFWSAAAIVYLIIRLDVDGAPWTEIDPPAAPQLDANANLPLAKPTETPV
jgi:hypothetical protein